MRKFHWFLLLAPASIVAAGAVYQLIGTRRDRRLFPAPGAMVGNVHIKELGTGSPAVVFESGLAASSLSWTWVQPDVAKFARTVSYDRLGLGWSGPSRGPRNLTAIVKELRDALRSAEVPAPYLLVGHSYGGLIVRAFAALHPGELAGLVLVDPVLPSEWIGIEPARARVLKFGVTLSRRGAWLARIGVVRFALALLMAGSRSVPQWIARISSGPGEGVMARLAGEVQKLPSELWPVVMAHWCNPECFLTMAGYMLALPENAETVQRIGAPQVPTVTIYSAQASEAQRYGWERIGSHVRAQRAGHWVQFDEPELVVEAIRHLLSVRD